MCHVRLECWQRARRELQDVGTQKALVYTQIKHAYSRMPTHAHVHADASLAEVKQAVEVQVQEVKAVSTQAQQKTEAQTGECPWSICLVSSHLQREIKAVPLTQSHSVYAHISYVCF